MDAGGRILLQNLGRELAWLLQFRVQENSVGGAAYGDAFVLAGDGV
jgi:hypothetical protein